MRRILGEGSNERVAARGVTTGARLWLAVLVAGTALFAAETQAAGEPIAPGSQCNRWLTADVVAFDMPLMFNRLGAQNINGMMFALRRDVVHNNPGSSSHLKPIGDAGTPGQVTLRPDKRPRPLVLRMGEGDCMKLKLTNLLAPVGPNPFQVTDTKDALTNCSTSQPPVPGEERSKIGFNCEIDDQVAARKISLRFQGTEWVDGEQDDGSNVGNNLSSLVAVGGDTIYRFHAPKDGAYIGVSYGGVVGGEGQGGTTASGLWAVLNVDPKDAVFYRSTLTRRELELALDTSNASGNDSEPPFGYNDVTGHPIINYEAPYPLGDPWAAEGKAGLPIVNMYRSAGVVTGDPVIPDGVEVFEEVHTAIDAIVAYGGKDDDDMQLGAPLSGPHAGVIGHFPPTIYPLESYGKRNPTVPNRLEPFRELTVAFHDEVSTKQAFPAWFEDPVFRHTLHGVRDSFMINYGSGGIGSEIIANRLGVGAMHDCVNCAYEEFFLTFHAVGEVGQLTDIPANFGLENCGPDDLGTAKCAAVGPKANYVLFPDDPSNVHHGYTGDATAFRNLHVGPGEQHVFHLHNHQWLFNADDDNSNYLDAQGLGPGAGYAYWINFGGGGNRNKTSGDVIFHCHFYPHFAQGMWEMWRLHDTFEPGTKLKATATATGDHTPFTVNKIGLGDGTPDVTAIDARALPDPEIVVGAPTPAVVPLPGKAMAPMPANVTVKLNPNRICVGAAPFFGVDKKNADGTCPTGFAPRHTGSLADVDRTSVFPDGAENPASYVSPGYPFWIAGMEDTVGNRPPTPPLDMMTGSTAQKLLAQSASSGDPLWSHPGLADAEAIDGWDGGLPRFGVQGYSAGSESAVAVTRLDMSKDIHMAKPVFFPEVGTDLEQVAMRFHAQRCHDSAHPDGTSAECSPEAVNPTGGYLTNGAPPIPGAPFMEPCIDDRGELLADRVTGRFFGGDLTAMNDADGMTVEGASPHSATKPRYYKAANVQFDAVFNKQGYHFPQQRIIALWQDVVPTIKQERPPEPFVLRLNSFDCTEYVHTNLVPKAYELDDYQVRTPTDIIGQHIHLPKWDLVSADGSANGWNYEDGTLSPEAVDEMIHAINAWQDAHPAEQVTKDVMGNDVVNSNGDVLDDDEDNHLHPLAHPFFGPIGFDERWIGARNTLQRWFADPVVNVQGVDRGLGIIFTHDHYGPSTHQQIGLYATVLMEPAGSKWVHNERGEQLGQSPDRSSPAGRIDGGPTSWQAAILTGDDGFGMDYPANTVGSNEVEDYREFYFEYTDFQHAYQPGVYVGVGANNRPITLYNGEDVAPKDGFIDHPILAADGNTFRDAIQPPVRKEASLVNGFPVDIWEFPTTCPGGVPRPCPEAITADDPGMYVVNYRNESLISRVYDPNRPGSECPDGKQGCQAKGQSGDLAFAMDSNVTRAISALNDKLGLAPSGYAGGSCTGGVFCPPINSLEAMSGGDPFTPMMRAYDGDRVHVKMQAGGQEEEHTATIHGLKWLQAGSGYGEAKNSGWRNAQAGGISEQFSLRTPVFADYGQRGNIADYAYSLNASLDGWVNGSWGVLRSMGMKRSDLFALPGNDSSKDFRVTNAKDFSKVCPKVAPSRAYDITAISANAALGKPAGVTIKDHYPGTHAGRAPDGAGGTLVYNSRAGFISGAGEVELNQTLPDGETLKRMGPIHDPTAILYVNTSDLESAKGAASTKDNDPYCWRAPAKPGGKWKYDPSLPACRVQLKSGVAVEPVVIRANAGDCLNVTLRNKVLTQAIDDKGYRLFQADGKPAFEDKRGKGPQYDLSADTNYDGVGDAAPYGTVHFDETRDLATGNAIPAVQRRDPGTGVVGMTSFQSNLMQPSAHVGLHPQLLEYDITKGDGTNVGQNPAQQSVAPGSQTTYQWYAGHIEMAPATGPSNARNVALVATPIEFGGFNLMPTDKIEQGQKGLIGAGVVYPQGSTFEVTAGTTSARVTPPSGSGPAFSDFTTVAAKGLSMFYANSYPVENILGEGTFGVAEDSQDMGHMSINYGNEAMWLRFGRNPTQAAGNALCAGLGADVCLGGLPTDRAADAFSNGLQLNLDGALGAAVGDPETAVFSVPPGDPFRMHVLMPFAAGRGSTFDLHGHVWLRDPYVCPGDADLGIAGKCDMGNGHAGRSGTGSVGSQALGENPIGMHLGGIESWFSGQHYEIVIPSAGGAGGKAGDYLFRDHMGLGNTGGLWGILRAEPAPAAPTGGK